MQILNDIAREIKKDSKKTVNKALFSTGLSLGTITRTKKLKLDNFKYELNYLQIKTSNTESKLDLYPGDRVLVAIVNSGRDHVVVGKVI